MLYSYHILKVHFRQDEIVSAIAWFGRSLLSFPPL